LVIVAFTAELMPSLLEAIVSTAPSYSWAVSLKMESTAKLPIAERSEASFIQNKGIIRLLRQLQVGIYRYIMPNKVEKVRRNILVQDELQDATTFECRRFATPKCTEIMAAISQVALTSATVFVPEGHQVRHQRKLDNATRHTSSTDIYVCITRAFL
jgi:hypothetical protein